MAGHVLRLQRERPAHACQTTAGEGGGGGRRRHGEVHSKKTWKIWVSAGMELAGSPVTETDGDFSTSNTPRGTSVPKCKYQ